MNNNQKIYLVFSLIGILVLLFVSQNLQPKTIKIIDITKDSINQNIKVEGKIISIREYNNKTFQVLEIEDDTASIEAIASSPDGLKDKLDLSKTYVLTGKVEEYNKTLQININKLEIKI